MNGPCRNGRNDVKMPISILLTVLCAAMLHASWNFFVKRNDDKFVAMSAMALGHAPYAVAAIFFSPRPAGPAAPYIVAGALLHVGYQFFLLNAYRIGDLSQVYPMARGAAPLMVALVSVSLLGLSMNPMEAGAVMTIGVGIMSLVRVRGADGLRNPRAAGLALATGGFIAAYSLVDGLGARAAGTALGYYGWLSALNAVLFALLMERVRPGTVTRTLLDRWPLVLGIGGASFLAYAMVTWAFTVAPIALVTALRETSIIFSLLLGVFVLKERFDRIKLAATAMTLIGVLLMRLAR